MIGNLTLESRYRVSSCHLYQCGFGLGQPEGHVHGTVEVDGGRQDDAGLLALAGLAIQPAQAKVGPTSGALKI